MEFGSEYLLAGGTPSEDFFLGEVQDGIAAVAEEQASAWALEAEQNGGAPDGFLAGVQRLGRVFAQSVLMRCFSAHELLTRPFPLRRRSAHELLT